MAVVTVVGTLVVVEVEAVVAAAAVAVGVAVVAVLAAVAGVAAVHARPVFFIAPASVPSGSDMDPAPGSVQLSLCVHMHAQQTRPFRNTKFLLVGDEEVAWCWLAVSQNAERLLHS